MGGQGTRHTISQQASKERIFEQLFKEKYDALFYYALNIIKSADEARDVVADSFERLWEHWDSVCDKPDDLASATATPLIYRYVRNACIDRKRRFSIEEKYKRVVIVDAFDFISLSEEPDPRLERVWQVIGDMPPQMRKAFTAVFVNGKSYKEAGETLGVTVNTIKTHIRNALRTLRNNNIFILFI